MTKFDFLITKTSDKMAVFIKLMQQAGLWEQGSIRELYNKYLHPDIMDYSDDRIWEALANGEVIDCFQFCTPLGLKSVKKCHPKNVEDTASLTSIMRLIAREGVENPVDRFKRMKDNPELWYQECREYGLTEEEITKLEPYFMPAFGNVCQQEDLMLMMMGAANFTLMESNQGRKVVSKKQMSKIPDLKEKFLKGMEGQRELFKQYAWEYGVVPLLGYGFPKAHAVPYSLIGIQNVVCYLYSPIIWATACLIVNAASIEEDFGNEYELEDEDSKANKTTQYDKIGAAIKQIQMSGIKVSTIDINRSGLTFEPDVETNEILYGLKPVAGLGEEDIEVIMNNRPYTSFEDFLSKTQVNTDKIKELTNEAKRKKTSEDRKKEIEEEIINLRKNRLSNKTILTLIKAGAFDKIEESSREDLVVNFCRNMSPQKQKLDTRSIPFLIENHLISEELEGVKAYKFREFIKKSKKVKIEEEACYPLTNKILACYESVFDVDMLTNENGTILLPEKSLEKQYNDKIRVIQDMLKDEELLKSVNRVLLKQTIINELKGKYDRSAWEMETMCFYYSQHELSDVNLEEYDIRNFEDIESKEVDSFFVPKKLQGKVDENGNQIQVPIFRIDQIIGTVVAKDKTRSSITLNTPKGSVEVKFNQEFFGMFDKRISKEVNGKKKVIEQSWFKRGSIIIVSGYRDGDIFRCKVYNNSKKHRIYRVYKISKDRKQIYFTHERKSE